MVRYTAYETPSTARRVGALLGGIFAAVGLVGVAALGLVAAVSGVA